MFGVEDAIHPRSGITTGEILAINEFGDPARNIPPRPFMRTSDTLVFTDLVHSVAKIQPCIFA